MANQAKPLPGEQPTESYQPSAQELMDALASPESLDAKLLALVERLEAAATRLENFKFPTK